MKRDAFRKHKALMPAYICWPSIAAGGAMEKTEGQIRAENREKNLRALWAQSEKGALGIRQWSRMVYTASRNMETEGLIAESTEHNGAPIYAHHQLAKAAVNAREDAGATVLCMLPILENQGHIIKLCWACLTLLGYIAYRVT